MSGIETGCANTYHDMSQLFEVDGTTQEYEKTEYLKRTRIFGGIKTITCVFKTTFSKVFIF